MSAPSANRAILLAGTLAASAMVVAAVSWSKPGPGESVPHPDVAEPVVVSPAPIPSRAAPSADVAVTRHLNAERPTQVAPPAVAPARPAPDPVEEERRRARIDRVRGDVAQVFESRRAVVVTRCFPEGTPGAPVAGITLQITVDAEGREIARGVHDSRALSPEISSCLREAMAGAVKIDPPGEKTDVEVYVSFP